MAKKKRKKTEDPIEQELGAIKTLLILLLMKVGTKQADIAKALKIDAGGLSRMMPAKDFKPFKWSV